MDDKLFLIHEALNCHTFIEAGIHGGLRRCECGRVQMIHTNRDGVPSAWVNCTIFGKEIVDEAFFNMVMNRADGSLTGLDFWGGR